MKDKKRYMVQISNLIEYSLDPTSPFNPIVGSMEQEEYSIPCKMHTAKSKRTLFIFLIENVLEIKLIEVIHFHRYEIMNKVYIFNILTTLEIACSYLPNLIYVLSVSKSK